MWDYLFTGLMSKSLFCFLFFLVLVRSLCGGAVSLAFSLQERFCKANAGDYVVMAQEGNYSVLAVRSCSQGTLVLEEVAVPQTQIDLKTMHWKQWVESGAPGHTAWTLYKMELPSGALIDCFSHSKKGRIHIDPSEQFLSHLFTLPWKQVPLEERKKMGPVPLTDAPDTRAIWNPALIIEGKKRPKAECVAMTTTWPDDGSRLARSRIDLYFAQECPDFPFPVWIEVQSPHYLFKSRAIDSGQGLRSPVRGRCVSQPEL